MRAARIIRSEIGANGAVEVVWNDNAAFFFDATNLFKPPEIVNASDMVKQEMSRRILVSRTSAIVTCEGCGIKI